MAHAWHSLEDMLSAQYQGRDYLFKFGNYIFPMQYIKEEGYKGKFNQRQDLDPWTDQTGLTHRNPVPHTKTEITITTRANLKPWEINALLYGIRSNYQSWGHRDAICSYYDQEACDWSDGHHMYLESSQEYGFRFFNPYTGRLRSPEMTFTFVEY